MKRLPSNSFPPLRSDLTCKHCGLPIAEATAPGFGVYWFHIDSDKSPCEGHTVFTNVATPEGVEETEWS